MNSSKIMNPYIEILRVTGILLLVLYHVGCMEQGQSALGKVFFFIFSKGWVGTDLFLVLAGYFFYSSFERTNGKVLLYYRKRALRLLPGYYLFLLLYLTLGVRLENYLGNHFVLPKGYWIYFFTFTANIPMALDRWSGIALEGLFGVSLLVQLLIIFSIIFKIVNKKKQRLKLIIILEVITIIIRFLPIFRESEWFSYFFTFTRMDGFLLGLSLALLRDSFRIKHFLDSQKVIMLILSFLLLLTIAPFTGWLETTHPMTSTLGFLLLGIFFTSLLNFLLTLKQPSWTFYGGCFVYSIYLAKLPLIYLIRGYLSHINMSLDKPYIFILLSLALCLLWGLIFSRIYVLRRRIIDSTMNP